MSPTSSRNGKSQAVESIRILKGASPTAAQGANPKFGMIGVYHSRCVRSPCVSVHICVRVCICICVSVGVRLRVSMRVCVCEECECAFMGARMLVPLTTRRVPSFRICRSAPWRALFSLNAPLAPSYICSTLLPATSVGIPITQSPLGSASLAEIEVRSIYLVDAQTPEFSSFLYAFRHPPGHTS